MSTHQEPPVKVWGSREKEGRRLAAPVVAKAFARSVSVATSSVIAFILSAVMLSLMFGIEQVAPQLPVLLPMCYVLNVAALWIACRLVPGRAGAQWWIIEDTRGRAAVLTKPTHGHTTAYNLAATPKRRGLAGDLMRGSTPRAVWLPIAAPRGGPCAKSSSPPTERRSTSN